jgi:excisionase family DNA binding protein
MVADERLRSIAEVAAYLGMSQDTVAAWIKTRRLKGCRIGRFWRVRPQDLEAFVNAPPPLRPREPSA